MHRIFSGQLSLTLIFFFPSNKNFRTDLLAIVKESWTRELLKNGMNKQVSEWDGLGLSEGKRIKDKLNECCIQGYQLLLPICLLHLFCFYL